MTGLTEISEEVPVENDSSPRLYIVFPRGLNSLVPGKLAAQAAHAANLLETDMGPEFSWTKEIYNQFYAWKRSAKGFGVTYVLGAQPHEFRKLKDIVRQIDNVPDVDDKFPCGIVHDPTYPVSDGGFIHHVPLDTAVWAFIPDTLERVINRSQNMTRGRFLDGLRKLDLY